MFNNSLYNFFFLPVQLHGMLVVNNSGRVVVRSCSSHAIFTMYSEIMIVVGISCSVARVRDCNQKSATSRR